MKSISQTENPIDESKRTAIIYSINDIGEYIIEIRHQQENYFVTRGKEPEKFGNLADAKTAAHKQAVEITFLALHKTYQEVEADKTGRADEASQFDYLPL